MLRHIRELLETDSAAVLLLSEDGQSLVMRAAIGMQEVKGMRIPLGQGVAGSIATSRAPVVVEDLSAVDVVNPVLRRNARSLIGAPLIVKGELIGVIHAETVKLKRFAENDVRLLQLAADRVALAIEQRRLYEVEQQARRQAEEANRTKDEFLALVSHELRSPLNAILGYTRMLRSGPEDREGFNKVTGVIERSAKAQLQIIEDLLDSARIVTGKLRIEPSMIWSRRLKPRSTRCARRPRRRASRLSPISATCQNKFSATRRVCSRSCGTCSRTRSSSRPKAGGSSCGWRRRRSYPNRGQRHW